MVAAAHIPNDAIKAHGTNETTEAIGREAGGIARAPRADAPIFALAADGALARARGRDAPVPASTAPPWPHRTAMANPARARRRRGKRGYGVGAHGLPAGAEPVADPARPRSAPSDRAQDRQE